MNLVYLDESVDTGFAVMCAVIVHEDNFKTTDGVARSLAEYGVPEDERDTFEFHAGDLFHGNKPFDKIDLAVRMELLTRFVQGVSSGIEPYPVIYGAVDLRILRAGLYSTAQPLDIAFRCCMTGIEEWFKKYYETWDWEKRVEDYDCRGPDLGLLVCDDTTNQAIKRNIQATYRARRGKVVPTKGGERHAPALADYLHDDMYFGDSAYSVGIQLADTCAFVIRRHLNGETDTEPLYQMVKPAIFYEQIEPKSVSSRNACSSTRIEKEVAYGRRSS